MKILITGNLGYVGPWVTRQLRARYPRRDADRRRHRLFRPLPDRCRAVAGSAARCPVLRRHAAAARRSCSTASTRSSISPRFRTTRWATRYEEVTLDVNHRAGVELARQAKAAGVRAFVFASSCSVYGSADDGPRTEQSEVDPLTAYARSKVLTEQALAELADQDFRVTCLRFATACGMSDRLRLDLVLNDFVASRHRRPAGSPCSATARPGGR